VRAEVRGEVHQVSVDDVLYFEAADKYVRVITAERELLVRTPLRDWLAQLDPQQFTQIHRGTIVNLRHVQAVVRDALGKPRLKLAGRSEQLAVSRLYAEQFKPM
jgi:DNA-binding LytR/AlgR family response regulator